MTTKSKKKSATVFRPMRPRRKQLTLTGSVRHVEIHIDHATDLALAYSLRLLKDAGNGIDPHLAGVVRRAMGMYVAHLSKLPTERHKAEYLAVARCVGVQSTPEDERQEARARLDAVPVGDPLPPFADVLKGMGTAAESSAMLARVDAALDATFEARRTPVAAQRAKAKAETHAKLIKAIEASDPAGAPATQAHLQDLLRILLVRLTAEMRMEVPSAAIMAVARGLLKDNGYMGQVQDDKGRKQLQAMFKTYVIKLVAALRVERPTAAILMEVRAFLAAQNCTKDFGAYVTKVEALQILGSAGLPFAVAPGSTSQH